MNPEKRKGLAWISCIAIPFVLVILFACVLTLGLLVFSAISPYNPNFPNDGSSNLPQDDDHTRGNADDSSTELVTDKEVLSWYRPEVELLYETVVLMKNGKNLPVPLADNQTNLLTYGDYDDARLREIKMTRETYDRYVILPTSADILFFSQEGFDEIYQILYDARAEYLELLRQEDIDEELVRELDRYVLPPDEDHLWLSYSDSLFDEFSFVRKTYDENSPLPEAYMRYEVISAYGWTTLVVRSGILGEVPESESEKMEYYTKAREYGVRVVMYHEMTHALQIAYERMIMKKYGEAYEDMSLIERSSVKFLSPERLLDTERYPFTESDNHSFGLEAQATLLQQHFMKKHFQLSENKAQALWNHTGGGERMEQTRKTADAILSSVSSSKFDQYRYMNTELGEIFEKGAPVSTRDYWSSVGENTSFYTLAGILGYCTDYSSEELERLFDGLSEI